MKTCYLNFRYRTHIYDDRLSFGMFKLYNNFLFNFSIFDNDDESP